MNDNIERVREVLLKNQLELIQIREMSFITHYLKNQKLD